MLATTLPRERSAATAGRAGPYPVMPAVLLTGATGYVGGRLAPRLAGVADASGDAELRLLMRRPARARLQPARASSPGDAVSGDGLDAALDGVETAYYLIHSMGRGGATTSPRATAQAAETFGAAAARAGVRRVIYLGGLSSDDASSAHLRSREEVAELLGADVPEFVHVRAAMVIGPGSASFQMLRALVKRLPAMVCPRWIDTRTQPIALDDVVGALAALRDRHDVTGDVSSAGRSRSATAR